METRSPAASAGVFRDRFRYVRIGYGARTLVVLPGLSLTNRQPGRLAVLGYAQGFRTLAKGHTLYVLQRPCVLRTAASTRDIAAEYAQLIRQEFGGVRLVGLSTGGMIAQHLALDHPALVERLVLVVAGARLSPRGRAICLRWRELAASGRWRRLHGELAAAAVDGAFAQSMAKVLLSLFGEPPTPVEAVDFVTTVDAVLRQDTRARLAGLAMPVLIVGGEQDAFFPASALRETAAPIPGVRLSVYEGVGHGLPKQRAARMTAEIRAFLSEAEAED
ncbi:alpha/beta hydrolase [Nonomuraea sp. NPDC046570]|uniref:alpha/beta fold hydrolase n=1 Tax=Nonomuraea sp. NPDC046570 TaxID=3155255 RepID=UPI0033CA40CE